MLANGGERTKSVITIRDLAKTYTTFRGEHVHSLEATSLDVESGEFFSLLGPSGCGKSTLLKTISGLVQPTSGECTVHLASGKVADSRSMGMVFQSPVLLPWRTVLDNVLLPADVSRNRPQMLVRAVELLEMVGLREFHRKYPFELSGGMQQRVALARALLDDPEILLMDEPFGALDAMTRDQMNDELLKIWERTKKTVIFVTHSIQEAVYLSDRVAVMTPRPGRIRQVIDVPLRRPRTADVMGTAAFAELCAHVRQVLNGGDRP